MGDHAKSTHVHVYEHKGAPCVCVGLKLNLACPRSIMWGSESWVFIDFEVFGIAAEPDSIKPGILGMLVETPETSTYICFILDEELKPLSNLFPEYTVYNPGHDLHMILHHIVQLDTNNECKYLFSWSNNDVEWLKRFFGELSEISELKAVNALPSARAEARAQWEMRRPHTLSRYLERIGYEVPKKVYPTELMRDLKSIWRNNPNNDSDMVQKKAYDLLRYNYHDCFGMRTVLRTLEGHTELPTIDDFFSINE
jgi:hypothetical protein